MAPIWAGTCRSCIWQGHASVTTLLGSASSPRAGKARDLRMLAPMTVAGVQITPDERRRDESSGNLFLLKLSTIEIMDLEGIVCGIYLTD